MIIRRTANVKTKKMITDRFDHKKKPVKVKVTTYWFLFVPIYTRDDEVFL